MKRLLALICLVLSISVSAQVASDSTAIKGTKPKSGRTEVKKAVEPKKVYVRDTATHVLHTDTIHPHTIIYISKRIMANAAYVYDKKNDSLIVTFKDHMIYSNMSMRPELSHLTDAKKRVRYSMLSDKKTFKVEKVNPDTTNFKYTYVRLKDTLIWKDYVGYRHKFTMKDQFTGTTYTVVLYECPEIKIDPEFAKYYFSELFFLKVPIKLTGGVIKALAE
jgi:hypothetical protein